MAGGYGESNSIPSQNPSSSSNNTSSSDAGDFECNICLDLAQDPIVTLCGHLFCWPCLYNWLYFHSQSHDCPVCKAIIQEEKLVPLYGRGKKATDPRSRSVPGVNIPDRPSGQRLQTAPPPPQVNHFGHHGFGFTGGWGSFAPMATIRLGNFAFSAAIGGLIPSWFNVQMHNGSPNAAMYGAPTGYHYGHPSFYHGGHTHPYHRRARQRQQDVYLKRLLFIVAFLVLFFLLSP